MALYKINDNTDCIISYEIIENILPVTTFFIHGNLSSNRWWYPSQEIWQAKSIGKNLSGHMVKAEFRGCGLSSAPKSKSEVNMFRFADDFIELITNLNLGTLNLVGHSTGGIISAIMLSKCSSLFKKAVLLNSVGAMGFRLDTSIVSKFEIMKLNKKLTSRIIGSAIYNYDPEDQFFNDIIVEDAFLSIKNGGDMVFDSLIDLNIADQLKKVNNDVLILHGEFDKLLSVKSSQELAKLFKNGKFQLIENQGHSANVENPELFVDLVNSFLYR